MSSKYSRNLHTMMDSLNVGDNSSDSNENEVEDTLVIGIDFGTTYSGVAWARSIDFKANDINFITSWPGNGREEGKVPTELWYADDDEEPSWGYEVPADCDPHRWFKLLLLHEDDLDPELRDSEFMVRGRNMMQSCGKTAVELVSDYLRLLWEHVMSTIERACGETVVDALAIHIVITVPAIWKGYARQKMEEAARASGILAFRLAGDTKLTLASEPEVAALATLHGQGSGVKAGDVYVICDAGGGTADLISYEVTSTKPIALQEAVEGTVTGGLCGGIFIDHTFERMCKGRLGSKWDRLSKAGIKEIMNTWEHGIKPQFKSSTTRKEYIIPLPAEAFRGKSSGSLDDKTREPYIKNGRIHYQGSHIVRTFEGVCDEITKLVGGQISEASDKDLSVTGIILVGGLGSSPYLYEHIKAAYSDTGIAVLQSGGMKPRTAICRGAVFKGFLQEKDKLPTPFIKVTSTISRASYGIEFNMPFNKHQHLEEDKLWDRHEDRWMATNQMRWYLKRGQNVSNIQPVRHQWYMLYREVEFNGALDTTLWECGDIGPPERKTGTIKKLGNLHCDLDVRPDCWGHRPTDTTEAASSGPDNDAPTISGRICIAGRVTWAPSTPAVPYRPALAYILLSEVAAHHQFGT
ncbi:hypothetical protein PG990_007530 [Apiospora arundinis]